MFDSPAAGSLSRTVTDSDTQDDAHNLFALAAGDAGGSVTLSFSNLGVFSILTNQGGTITASAFTGSPVQTTTLTLPSRGQTQTFIFRVRSEMQERRGRKAD
jgi:hypothetical protein